MSNVIHHSEQTFRFWRGDQVLMEGTPDAVWVYPTFAVCCERKFGYKEVQGADANLQLRAYLVMIADVYPKDAYYGILTQPRISYKPNIVRYTAKDIVKARLEIETIYDLCFGPNPPRKASVEGCTYCTAKALCAEFRAFIGDIEKVQALPVNQWSDEAMDIFETRRGLAQKFLEDTHKAIVQIKMANPERLPGWRLKDGAEVRRVKDLVAAWNALTPVIGNDKEAAEKFSDCCDISIGKLETMIWSQRQGTDRPISQKDAKRLVNEVLSTLIDFRRNKPSLVKNDE